MGAANTVMEPDLANMGLGLNEATQILGSKRVVSIDQATKAWGLRVDKQPRVLYDEETLRQCVRENTSQLCDWRLVYINGLPLRRQREIVGVNIKNHNGFVERSWWKSSLEDSWVNQKTASGYLLIDFRGRFGHKTWYEQEELIEGLGTGFRRTHEVAISEAILTFFKVSNTRLLADWYHWGISQNYDANNVFVGCFESGLDVSEYDPSSGHRQLKVCVSRSFQY